MNRELLYKLLIYNIDGKMFGSINGLHIQRAYRACIKIINIYTDFLILYQELKQKEALLTWLTSLTMGIVLMT